MGVEQAVTSGAVPGHLQGFVTVAAFVAVLVIQVATALAATRRERSSQEAQALRDAAAAKSAAERESALLQMVRDALHGDSASPGLAAVSSELRELKTVVETLSAGLTEMRQHCQDATDSGECSHVLPAKPVKRPKAELKEA